MEVLFYIIRCFFAFPSQQKVAPFLNWKIKADPTQNKNCFFANRARAISCASSNLHFVCIASHMLAPETKEHKRVVS